MPASAGDCGTERGFQPCFLFLNIISAVQLLLTIDAVGLVQKLSVGVRLSASSLILRRLHKKPAIGDARHYFW